MKHLILSLLISGAGHTISAQEVIKGIIKDETGEPLVGANVVWLNTTAGTTTDLDGAFHLNRNSATDKLVVSYIGYQSDTLSIAKNAAPLDVQLKSNLTLDEVIVRAPGTGTMTSRLEPFQMQKMSTAEFQRAACCNLSEAFETNPSVDVAYSDAATGAKQIRLLGLSNAYVQMLTENNPSFRGAASLYGMDYIPGPWMESIQVSKGAASVKNGYEAVTGQINVEYKKPDKADPLTLNLFAADNGRIEGNADGNILLNDNLATGLFLHYSNDKQSHDANKDGFLIVRYWSSSTFSTVGPITKGVCTRSGEQNTSAKTANRDSRTMQCPQNTSAIRSDSKRIEPSSLPKTATSLTPNATAALRLSCRVLRTI